MKDETAWITIYVLTKYKLLQGEPSFHLFGFIMCVGATAARALKTVLQGILMSSEGYNTHLFVWIFC
jgi:hypothetical protein